jgi:hypothetical protein
LLAAYPQPVSPTEEKNVSNASSLSWRVVETQSELDDLLQRVVWEDAEVVAFVGGTLDDLELLPKDVSRSGYSSCNVRVLLQILMPYASHLELVLTACDAISLGPQFSIRGRIDSLGRLEVCDREDRRMLRCSKLSYRFLTIEQVGARDFYWFERSRDRE